MSPILCRVRRRARAGAKRHGEALGVDAGRSESVHGEMRRTGPRGVGCAVGLIGQLECWVQVMVLWSITRTSQSVTNRARRHARLIPACARMGQSRPTQVDPAPHIHAAS
jgi:hypothetical protein